MSSPRPAGAFARGVARIDVAVVGTAGPAEPAMLRALVARRRPGPPSPGRRAAGPHRRRASRSTPSPSVVAGTQFRHADPADPALVQALAGVHAAVIRRGEHQPRRRTSPWARGRAGGSGTCGGPRPSSPPLRRPGCGHLVVVTSATGLRRPARQPRAARGRRAAAGALGRGQVGDLMDVEQLVAVARDVHPGLTHHRGASRRARGRRRRHRHHPPLRGAPAADGAGRGAGLAVLPRRRPRLGRRGRRGPAARAGGVGRARGLPDAARPRAADRDAPGRAQHGRGHGNCRPPPPRWGVAGTRQRPGLRGLPWAVSLRDPAGPRVGAGPRQ